MIRVPKLRTKLAVTFLALSVLPTARSQEAAPVASFKVQASSVVVDVIVTDKKGHHISGLTEKDFSISENGIPQKIVSFSPSEGTVQAASSVPAAEAKKPATPNTPTTETAKPHLLTVVLDLADNRPENFRKSCDTVLKYLDQNLSANDYVAIYFIDRGLHLALPFTNDLAKARDSLKQLEQRIASGAFTGSERSTVQKQIDDLYTQAHPSAQLGMDTEAAAFVGGRGNTAPGNTSAVFFEREMSTLRSYIATQNTFQARAVFVALRAICLSYRDIPGRKNVVLFSEGFLYSDDARSEMEAVADAANRANVAFYVIDPIGLEIAGGGVLGRGTSTTVQQMAAIALEGPSRPGQSSGGQTKFDHMRNLGETSRNEQLSWLADTTGGIMVKNTNDLLPAFSKVIEDARDFYTLVYQPTDKEFDGKFRSIKLDLQQRGYQLRYRQGYWAIPHAQAVAMTPAAAQLVSAASKGALKSAFPANLNADLLLAPDGHYYTPVSVSVPGNKVPIQKNGKDFAVGLTLVVFARDSKGQIVTVHQRDWHIQLNDKQRDDFQKRTLTIQTQLATAELQNLDISALLQFADGTVAMGNTPIAFSGTSESGPRISSLLLSERAETATCPEDSDPLCIQKVRLYQPALSQFQSAGRLIVYFTADNLTLDEKTKQPRVSVRFTLKESANAMKSPIAENVQALPGPTPNSVLVFAEYDLKSLRSGNYTLQATTQDLVRKTAASEETKFAIQ